MAEARGSCKQCTPRPSRSLPRIHQPRASCPGRLGLRRKCTESALFCLNEGPELHRSWETFETTATWFLRQCEESLNLEISFDDVDCWRRCGRPYPSIPIPAAIYCCFVSFFFPKFLHFQGQCFSSMAHFLSQSHTHHGLRLTFTET